MRKIVRSESDIGIGRLPKSRKYRSRQFVWIFFCEYTKSARHFKEILKENRGKRKELNMVLKSEKKYKWIMIGLLEKFKGVRR